MLLSIRPFAFGIPEIERAVILTTVKVIYSGALQCLFSDSLVESPVAIDCVHAETKDRVIVATASHGADLRHIGIVCINCHKTRDSALYGKLVNYVRLCYAILRQSSFQVIHHDRHGTLSYGRLSIAEFTGKRISVR